MSNDRERAERVLREAGFVQDTVINPSTWLRKNERGGTDMCVLPRDEDMFDIGMDGYLSSLPALLAPRPAPLTDAEVLCLKWAIDKAEVGSMAREELSGLLQRLGGGNVDAG